MTVLGAPKIEQLSRASDPKQALIDAVGDLSGVDVFNDLVLVGTFIRNELMRNDGTLGKIIRPMDNVKEDEHQGKVGLVLKAGPIAAMQYEKDDELGQNATLHTWVVFQNSHSWPLQINGVACRLLPYDKVRMRTNNPNLVF